MEDALFIHLTSAKKIAYDLLTELLQVGMQPDFHDLNRMISGIDIALFGLKSLQQDNETTDDDDDTTDDEIPLPRKKPSTPRSTKRPKKTKTKRGRHKKAKTTKSDTEVTTKSDTEPADKHAISPSPVLTSE